MAKIKCPNCGATVSSLAFTCPGCNVPIKDNVYPCPECHEWVFVGDTVCEHCGADLTSMSCNDAAAQDTGTCRLRSVTPADSITRVAPAGIPGSKPSTTRKGGCMRTVAVLLLTLLVVGGMAFGGFMYYESREQQKAAVMEELQRRIVEDEKQNAQQLLLAQTDSAAWRKALRNRSIEMTEAYIAEYPEGIFINEAYMLLEELNRRKVSGNEHNNIKIIVDNRLNAHQKDRLRKKDKDVLGLHYSIDGELRIEKKYITRDSFQYQVHGTVSETINRTDPTKPTSSTLKLDMLLSAAYKVVRSNI